MKLTEQQFLESLTADQSTYFNGRLIEIRGQFQASYAASVADVSAAKDQLLDSEKQAHAGTMSIASTVPQLTQERDKAIADVAELQSQVGTIPGLLTQIAELTAEVNRLTALVPPPLPPRTLYPRELLGRFTFSEVVAAIRTDNDAAIYAVANLQTTVAPVNLDSDETRTLIGALVVAGIITSDRLAEILS